MIRHATLLVFLLAAVWACHVHAAVITVPCSVNDLESAITTSQFNGEPDIIHLAAGCTYTLTAIPYQSGGVPTIFVREPLAIHGHGAIIERSTATGIPEFRVLEVILTADVASTPGQWFLLDNVTLSNGLVSDGNGGGMSISDSSSPEDGGSVVLDGLVVENNAALIGGGLHLILDASVELSNSRVIGNFASIYSGGINAGGADVRISSSLIRENTQGSPSLLTDFPFLGALLSGAGGLGALDCGNLVVADSEISYNESHGLAGGGIGILLSSGTMINTRIHHNISHTVDGVQPGDEYGSAGGVGIGNFTAEPGGNLPTFLIQRSAIYANVADTSAGGLGVAGGVEVTLANTTVSGNSAGVRGGGVGDAADLLTLRNVTVADNSAPSGAGVDIGNYVDYEGNATTGSLVLVNSVIGDNLGSTDCALTGGIITANSASMLETDATAGNACDGANGTAFALRGDPGLSVFGDHGGPDFSHLPETGSALIDAGAPGQNSSPTDQRGACHARVRGIGIDIGAIETGNDGLIFCHGFDPSTAPPAFN